ncbi:uncharacterized protein METZ01_LOCUS189642 [marine metagenome]|uniref:Uncharacterized protein n=1 Tax=marine metagenome TaxID=408172 RepID=A0A382DEG2_9ZZZZ
MPPSFFHIHPTEPLILQQHLHLSDPRIGYTESLFQLSGPSSRRTITITNLELHLQSAATLPRRGQLPFYSKHLFPDRYYFLGETLW